MANEVLKDSKDKCCIIRDSLSHGELPGAIEDYKDAPGLPDIVRQCWKRAPMLRPTASIVAQRLIDVTAHLAVVKSSLVSPDMQSSAATISISDEPERCQIGIIQQRTLDVIRNARHVNKDSIDLVQPTARTKVSDFKMLLEEDGIDPLTSFILGTAFWMVQMLASYQH
jgi:hypothetical protein